MIGISYRTEGKGMFFDHFTIQHATKIKTCILKPKLGKKEIEMWLEDVANESSVERKWGNLLRVSYTFWNQPDFKRLQSEMLLNKKMISDHKKNKREQSGKNSIVITLNNVPHDCTAGLYKNV